MKYVIANLKSNQTKKEALEYSKKIKKIKNKNNQLIICPSFTNLFLFNDQNYNLGAQNISEYEKGAYTGEINGEQLQNLNCKYVIIGHSERRKYFNENNKILLNKITQALKNNLKIIFCIGESLEEYKANQTKEILQNQITSIFNSLDLKQLNNIIIAYEPIWAIGTGLIPSLKEIEENIYFIKKLNYQNYHLNLFVLYGGSVDENNINDLKTISNLDGYLIGGASLSLEKLKKIILT